MSKSWRDLRVGDRIRIVRLPTGWERPGYHVPPATRRLYRLLIDRHRPVRVYEIDQSGLPWIHCRFQKRGGSWEHHFLAVNDDSWVPGRAAKYNV